MTATTATHRNSAPCTADPTDAPAERETAAHGPETLHSAVTNSDKWGRLLDQTLAYFTPPAILTDQPATIPDLSRYAHRGAWTARTDGPIRAAGIWWWRLAALPTTIACRTWEWIAQRPGRAIPIAVITKLLASTTPGNWVVHHLIAPLTRAAIWLFL